MQIHCLFGLLSYVSVARGLMFSGKKHHHAQRYTRLRALARKLNYLCATAMMKARMDCTTLQTSYQLNVAAFCNLHDKGPGQWRIAVLFYTWRGIDISYRRKFIPEVARRKYRFSSGTPASRHSFYTISIRVFSFISSAIDLPISRLNNSNI